MICVPKRSACDSTIVPRCSSVSEAAYSLARLCIEIVKKNNMVINVNRCQAKRHVRMGAQNIHPHTRLKPYPRPISTIVLHALQNRSSDWPVQDPPVIAKISPRRTPSSKHLTRAIQCLRQSSWSSQLLRFYDNPTQQQVDPRAYGCSYLNMAMPTRPLFVSSQTYRTRVRTVSRIPGNKIATLLSARYWRLCSLHSPTRRSYLYCQFARIAPFPRLQQNLHMQDIRLILSYSFGLRMGRRSETVVKDTCQHAGSEANLWDRPIQSM